MLLLLDYANVALTILKGIVLVPLYLRSFDLAVYGSWLAWSNVLAVVGSLEGGLGLVLGERVARFHGAGDGASLAESASSGAALAATMGTLIAIVGLGAAPLVASALSDSGSSAETLQWAFRLAAVGAGFSVVNSMTQTVLRGLQSAWAQGAVRVSALVFDVGATVMGLMAGFGVISLGLGMLVGGAVGILVGTGLLVRVWRTAGLPRPMLASSSMLSLVSLTAPLFGSRLAGTMLSNAEMAVVAFFVNPAAAGVLGLTDRIYKVGLLLVNPVASAVFPGLANLVGQRDSRRVREVVREVIALFSAVAATVVPVALALNGSFVSVWVGPSNFGGTAISMLLAVAAVLTARLNLMWWLLAALGDVQRTVWANLMEMVLRIGVMAALVRQVGMLGVPLAVITTTLAFGFWYYSYALSSRLELPGSVIRVTGVPGLVAALLAGGLLATILPRATGWVFLSLLAVPVCLVISGIVLALNTAARRVIVARMA